MVDMTSTASSFTGPSSKIHIFVANITPCPWKMKFLENDVACTQILVKLIICYISIFAK